MYTKGKLVRASFAQLALAGYVFDLDPEEIQDAIRTMDAMMAVWDGQGIRLGYNQTSDPDATDPAQDSGLADASNMPVYMNTAMMIAAEYGKTPMRTTAIAAKQGYDMLLSRAVSQNTVPMQLPGTMPAGSGNKNYGYGAGWGRGAYLRRPVDPITVGPDGPLTFN